mgnify:CR=1 FL=1
MSTITSEQTAAWDGLELVATREDIKGGIEWSIHDHRHAVIVHLNGRMTALETELDGRAMSLEPANAAEIWIVPAGTRYAGRAEGGEIDYAVVYLDSDAIGRFLPGATYESIAPVHGLRDDYCYQSVCELLRVIQHSDDLSQLLADSIRQALCLHLFRSYGDASAVDLDAIKTGFDDRTMQLLRSYIHDNLAETIRIQDLSAVTGLRRERLLSEFRTAFGQTPGQYVIAQRIRRAQWLLANSSHAITEIAYETGFSSHGHFSRTFRKHVGETPQGFRRKWS